MNARERKERIDKLWRKLRFIVKTKGALSNVMTIKEASRRERFGLDTDRSECLPESQELESQLVYEETGLHGNLPGYIINPELTFSKVKNVWVQTMTWTNLIITPVAFVFYETAG